MPCFVSYVGAVAPVFTCVGTVTTSFVSCKCVFDDFLLFVWLEAFA